MYWRKLSSRNPKFFGRVGYYMEEEKHMRMARMLMEMTTLFGYIDTVWKSTRVLASLH